MRFLNIPRRFYIAFLVSGIIGLTSCTTALDPGQGSYQDTFNVSKSILSSTGTSRYFVLESGRRMIYKHGDATLISTVLDETRLVDGVQTRVIEEREEEAGAVKEVSRNYFAMDPATGDLYYFGEDVDNYKDGKVAHHAGSWLSGVNGAHFGLMLPGKPTVGRKFQHEVAPGVAMDRGETVNIGATVKTPAGMFNGCVEAIETTPMDKDIDHKVYAPGVGLVRDDEFELVKIEKPQARQ